MTLQEFSRDVVPIAQLVLTLAGLVSLFLLWNQMRQTTLWNRLSCPLNFIDTELSGRLEAELLRTTTAIGIDLTKIDCLTDEQSSGICSNPDARLAVKNYLTYLENVCAAVQVGAAEPDLAYHVHSVRVEEAWTVFKPFVTQLRKSQDDDDIYRELSKTAVQWSAREKKEREARRVQLEAERKRLEVEQEKGGVPKKVT